MTILETPRLLLRQLTLDDLEALHHIFSDPVTMSFWPAPFSLEQTRGWIGRSIRSYEENGFGRYAVVLKENGRLIGDCGIIRSEIDGVEENDLGYIISRDQWKQGYATEAAEACMRHAFDVLKLERICANMAHDHHGSRRVAERIGMTFEREFRNRRNRDILTRLYSASPSRSTEASCWNAASDAAHAALPLPSPLRSPECPTASPPESAACNSPTTTTACSSAGRSVPPSA
jgi:RimJ/RimL family protein N-acetyltransferase